MKPLRNISIAIILCLSVMAGCVSETESEIMTDLTIDMMLPQEYTFVSMRKIEIVIADRNRNDTLKVYESDGLRATTRILKGYYDISVTCTTFCDTETESNTRKYFKNLTSMLEFTEPNETVALDMIIDTSKW